MEFISALTLETMDLDILLADSLILVVDWSDFSKLKTGVQKIIYVP